jgi:hypothetical protein
MKTTTEHQTHVGHDEIAQRAREIWEREGRQSGRDLEYWLRAERELNERQSRTRTSASASASEEISESAWRRRSGKSPGSRTIHI